jgi:hypothetical protein
MLIIVTKLFKKTSRWSSDCLSFDFLHLHEYLSAVSCGPKTKILKITLIFYDWLFCSIFFCNGTVHSNEVEAGFLITCGAELTMRFSERDSFVCQ